MEDHMLCCNIINDQILRIIGTLLKNNGHSFGEYKNRMIGKILSIIYKGLIVMLIIPLASIKNIPDE